MIFEGDESETFEGEVGIEGMGAVEGFGDEFRVASGEDDWGAGGLEFGFDFLE